MDGAYDDTAMEPPGENFSPPPGPLKKSGFYSPGERLFSLYCLLLGYTAVSWLFFGGYGFGSALFTGLFCLGMALFLRPAARPYRRCFWSGLAVLLAFGASFALNGGQPVSLLAGGFVMVVGFLWVYRSASGEQALIRRHWLGDQLRALFVLPFCRFSDGVVAFGQMFQRLPGKRRLGWVLLGLLIALPVTLVAGGLLLQADPVFSQMMDGLAEGIYGFLGDGFFTFLLRLLLAVPAGLALFSLAYASRRRVNPPVFSDDSLDRAQRGMRVLPQPAAIAALTPLCALYLLFFVSQSAYFFSAFHHYLPAGFTYAAYARRGFFELCAVAVINLVMLLLLTLFCRRETERPPAAVRLFSAILSLFTLLLIATALRKMLLYIEAYGLTSLRVYTSWFMLLLAAVFLLLLIRQFVPRFPLARGVGIAFVLLLGALTFANVDARIASYNVSRYQSGQLEQVDVQHLSQLSDAALPYLYPLLRDTNPDVAADARVYYESQRERLRDLPVMRRSAATIQAMDAIRRAEKEGLLR